MQAPASFSALLSAATAASRRLEEEGVLSLALPLAALDPLAALTHLGSSGDFRFLWDGAP